MDKFPFLRLNNLTKVLGCQNTFYLVEGWDANATNDLLHLFAKVSLHANIHDGAFGASGGHVYSVCYRTAKWRMQWILPTTLHPLWGTNLEETTVLSNSSFGEKPPGSKEGKKFKRLY